MPTRFTSPSPVYIQPVWISRPSRDNPNDIIRVIFTVSSRLSGETSLQSNQRNKHTFLTLEFEGAVFNKEASDCSFYHLWATVWTFLSSCFVKNIFAQLLLCTNKANTINMNFRKDCVHHHSHICMIIISQGDFSHCIQSHALLLFTLWKVDKTFYVKLVECPFNIKTWMFFSSPLLETTDGFDSFFWICRIAFILLRSSRSLKIQRLLCPPSLFFRCQISSLRWLADHLIEMAQYFSANPWSSQLRLFFTCVRSVIVVKDGRHIAQQSACTLFRIKSDHLESCRSPLFYSISVDFAGACARPFL